MLSPAELMSLASHDHISALAEKATELSYEAGTLAIWDPSELVDDTETQWVQTLKESSYKATLCTSRRNMDRLRTIVIAEKGFVHSHNFSLMMCFIKYSLMIENLPLGARMTCWSWETL